MLTIFFLKCSFSTYKPYFLANVSTIINGLYYPSPLFGGIKRSFACSLKGYFGHKLKFCHLLLTLMMFEHVRLLSIFGTQIKIFLMKSNREFCHFTDSYANVTFKPKKDSKDII